MSRLVPLCLAALTVTAVTTAHAQAPSGQLPQRWILAGDSIQAQVFGNAEFNLLAAFLASPQRVLTREQLLSMSHLHNDEVYDRAVDTQVGRLRRKLEEHAGGQELIRTERGAGYVLTVPVEVVR